MVYLDIAECTFQQKCTPPNKFLSYQIVFGVEAAVLGEKQHLIVVNHLGSLFQGWQRMSHFVKYFYSGVKYLTGSTEIFYLYQ